MSPADIPELRDTLACATLCNSASLRHENGVWRVVGDPTEGALLAATAKGGIEQSIRRIRAAGKAAGFLAVDPKMAQKSLEWGANFVAVGVDTQLYTDALDSRLAMFRPGVRREEEKGSY